MPDLEFSSTSTSALLLRRIQLLLPTAPEVPRNRDSLYAYRHDSYFYYLSGFPEPEAVIALVAAPDGDRHLLFCRERGQNARIERRVCG